jgi:hypothetical protein
MNKLDGRAAKQLGRVTNQMSTKLLDKRAAKRVTDQLSTKLLDERAAKPLGRVTDQISTKLSNKRGRQPRITGQSSMKLLDRRVTDPRSSGESIRPRNEPEFYQVTAKRVLPGIVSLLQQRTITCVRAEVQCDSLHVQWCRNSRILLFG